MTDHREEDLEERRRRLTTELAERDAKVKDEERAEINADQTRKGYGMAMKISSEFISAIIVGAILGYLFDYFVGTGPWGMIVMLLIGFCAGVLNVMRVVGIVASPHPADRRLDLDDKGNGR
ncbi:MAG: AtpZ/AtpI family protein [Alphaproteobacteria bacterium]|jgi:ATP synthase protein I|uniref:AtpZ/AtpI family protein n=1 Tax=Rhizobium/Agrobacterium group TaxID=227290 RepID=UPI0006B8830C|nr:MULTISPECIES: AtpZ/AtpI family protein [Rhizobium/Agrobacterium group]MBU0740466.1 AtpZ/AtpI family protein [Alphaproteobacteria bacterium]MDM7978929.1 AtpZ/AtpI family protein [Rhizobium sp.]AOG11762.1 F0F1-ATPase subunit family protein [Agrobacterium sp. RAC06]KPF59733.1 ATP synthase [Rhizobium sp. AAP116]MBU0831272.1 AtpZ/AtpI family protein [Alphaproteobacteria bacterium]